MAFETSPKGVWAAACRMTIGSRSPGTALSLRAVVQLNTLRCIHENESGGAEPYVWPFMVAIHTGPAYETATTPTLAGIVESRHIIASSMKAGQAADLQFPGNNLAYQFDDGQTGCQVLLVVAGQALVLKG